MIEINVCSVCPNIGGVAARGGGGGGGGERKSLLWRTTKATLPATPEDERHAPISTFLAFVLLLPNRDRGTGGG